MGVTKAVRNVSYCGMYARTCILVCGVLICLFTSSAECSEERRKAGGERMKHAMNATCANQAGASDAGAILAAIWREPDNLNPLLRTGSSMHIFYLFCWTCPWAPMEGACALPRCPSNQMFRSFPMFHASHAILQRGWILVFLCTLTTKPTQNSSAALPKAVAPGPSLEKCWQK